MLAVSSAVIVAAAIFLFGCNESPAAKPTPTSPSAPAPSAVTPSTTTSAPSSPAPIASGAALDQRTRIAVETAPLPTASLVWRAVRPTLEISAPSLQPALVAFVRSLGPPYVLRSHGMPFFFSPLSLDAAESRLGAWLVGGVCTETPVFDDDPYAGWTWVGELLLHLDAKPGGARCYAVDHLLESHAQPRCLLAVTLDRIVMLVVVGYD